MPNPDRLTPIQFYCRGVSAFDRRQWKMAVDSLSSAVQRLDPLDTPAEFVASHYYLGCAFESLNDLKAAEKHYIEVLAIDYDYKDTLQRIGRISPS